MVTEPQPERYPLTARFEEESVQRLRVQWNDFDEMAASGAEWDNVYRQFGRGRFVGQDDLIRGEGLEFGMVSWSLGLRIDGSIPRDTHVFALPVDPSGKVFTQGGPLTSGEILSLSDSGEIDLLTTSHTRLLLVCLPKSTLGHLASELAERSSRTNGRLRLLDDSARRNVIGTWTRLLDRGPSMAADALRTEVLDVLCESVADGDGGNAPRSKRRRMAVEFERRVRSSEAPPESVREVCRSMQVAERTLRLGFREVYGQSPKAYLTSLALSRAHSLLKGPRPIRRIRDIAMEVGIEHFGRFSQLYKDRFGELPSETQKRQS